MVAIVLAAGAGRRFGGAKQLALVGADGEPMVAHVTRQVLAVDGIDEVLVVVGAHRGDVEAALPGLGERTVPCDAWADGIGTSLAAGIAAAGPLDAALIVLGDQPLIDAALIDTVLRRGLAALASGGCDAARPVGPHGEPGHPVILGPTAIQVAASLRGDRGALAGLEPRRIHGLAVDGPASTFDIDAPGDLIVARAMLAAAVVPEVA